MRGPDDYRAAEQSASDNSAAANAAATATAAAVDGEYWVLDSIHWSFDGTPTSTLTITIGAIKWRIDITQDAQRFGEVLFPRGLTTRARNTALSVLLGPGGTGVKGKVNITYH